MKLFGCNSGEVVRWPGLVTYSDTAAQVRAVSGMPVELQLYNKSPMPAFVAARMQFNGMSTLLLSYIYRLVVNKYLNGRYKGDASNIFSQRVSSVKGSIVFAKQ